MIPTGAKADIQPVPGGHSRSSTDRLILRKAAKRRLEELKRLPFQVFAICKWHYRVGSVHIWIHAGRWWNEATGIHGSLRTVSVRTLAISEWNRQLECLISKVTCTGRSAIG